LERGKRGAFLKENEGEGFIENGERVKLAPWGILYLNLGLNNGEDF